MSLAIRSVSTLAGATGTSRDVPKPSGVVEGDLMIMQIGSATTGYVTMPPGWFLISRGTGTNGVHLYGKYAGDSEPATYTVGFSSSTTSVFGILAVYSDDDSRIAVTGITETTGSASTNRTFFTDFITYHDNCLLCCFGAVSVASSDNTPDAAMTEQWDLDTTRRIFLMTEFLGVAGSEGGRVATGPSATFRGISIALVELPQSTLPDPEDTRYFYGDPDYFVLWNTESVVRTSDIMANPPVWEEIDTGIIGMIYDGIYQIVDSQTVGMWLMTSDAIWWSDDIKAETVTWENVLDITTVQAECETPHVDIGSQVVFAGMATLRDLTPGFLCVSISLADEGTAFDAIGTSASYSYNHCYFYRTEDYGQTWELIDATNLSHVYTGLSQRNYCFASRLGLASGGGETLWCLRITQRRILDYRARVLTSNDAGLTWSDSGANLDTGLNNFLDGALLGVAAVAGSAAFASYGEVGVSARSSVSRSGLGFSWAVTNILTAVNLAPFRYGGASGYWPLTRFRWHPDHVLGLFRFSSASYHLLESHDQGESWNFVWHTRSAEGDYPGIGSSTLGSWYAPPISWPGDSRLWVAIRAAGRPSTTELSLLQDIAITTDFFRTTEDRSGNLDTLISWTVDGGNGFFLPKPTEECRPRVLYTYGGIDITDYCHSLDFEKVLDDLERITLGSVAGEYRPGLGSNSIGLAGNWSPEIDAILGRDALTGTRRTGEVAIDDCNYIVRYNWSDVFVRGWRVQTAANGKIEWSASLRHNGRPVRTITLTN